MEDSIRWPWKVPLIAGVLTGVAYGTFFRLFAEIAGLVNARLELVMTFGFLLLGPFAIGYLTVAASWGGSRRPVVQWIFAPWIGILACAGIAWAIELEGLICVVLLLPIGLSMSSMGGIAAGVTDLLVSGRNRSVPIACVALLPLAVAPAEAQWATPPVQLRTVQTEIRIHAPAEVAWRNIERVRPIATSELRPVWTHAIGFPRPVEATLSHEGAGGVRHASFEHGLLFIETVTAWEPDQRLAFSIKADTADIPPATLDEHVTVGGRYFDVLNGEYRIERVADGDVVLHLSSEERLSTDFNGYAGLWSDAVMRNLQTSILEVIRNRCEREAAPNTVINGLR